jgi:multiple sugar transport system permease protein
VAEEPTVLRKIAAYLLLLALALTMVTPFIWMVLTSFMDELEVFTFPPKFIPDRFLWQNYTEALTVLPFARFFLNSAVMSLAIVAGQLVICSLAAYAFARLDFPGRDKIFIAYLSYLMIPAIVLLIPRFLLVNSFRWVDTFWALIVPEVVSVWGIFLLRQFFMTLPRELEDAARIDGASELRIFWSIVLPLSRPALATLGIFAFIGSWQSFLWPLIATRSVEMRPVEVGISMFHSIYVDKWPQGMAAATVAVIPLVVLFFFTQRYFIRGIALTGMKG